MNHIAFLSQEIGARPANTEEEQRAAMYISESFERDARLSSEIEEFNCNSHAGLTRAIYCAVTILVTALSLVIPVMAIPALVISIVMAGCLVAETLDFPILSRLFNRGMSQNVVAKYEPHYSAGAAGARRRKIIVVAHYDSGHLRRDLNGPFVNILHGLQIASLVAMIVVPVVLLIHDFFFLHATGTTALAFTIVTIVALAVCALPILQYIAQITAAYNDAANSNASGVGVLLELARLVGNDMVGTQGKESTGVMHGEEAAYAEGVIPEGAGLTYEGAPGQNLTPEEGLLAAKAAIAAMTGQPMSDFEVAQTASIKTQHEEQKTIDSEAPSEDVLTESTEVSDPDVVEASPAEIHEETSQEVENQKVEDHDDDVPDWYRQAKAAAKHNDDGIKENQRSRFAVTPDFGEESFMDTAQEIMNNHADEITPTTTERIQSLQADIMSAQAPQREVIADDSVDAQETKQHSVADAAVAGTASAVVAASAVAVDSATQDIMRVPTAKEAPVSMPAINPQKTTAMPAVGGALDLEALRAEAQEPALSVQPFVPAIAPDATQEIPQRAFVEQPRISVPEVTEPANLVASDLPSISAATLPSIDINDFKQRAPLAASADQHAQSAAQSLLSSTLPSIEAEPQMNLPSIDPQDLSLVPQQVTTAFAPIDMSDHEEETTAEGYDDFDENFIVDDAEDGLFEQEFADPSEFGKSGYVEMPQSRFGKFFGKFSRKNKKERQESAQDWLGVDDDFDARSVGRDRGGWESFRDDDDWEGGAFSNLKRFGTKKADREMVSEYDDAYSNDAMNDVQGYYPESAQDYDYQDGVTSAMPVYSPQNQPQSNLGNDVQERRDHVTEVAEYDGHYEPHEEIFSFASGGLSTEVWFVALGSELADQGGIKAFLARHADEMRGAILINLESMGDGELCYIEKEGFIKQAALPSRMKRYLKQAARMSGVTAQPARIPWRESASSYAVKHRMQAMSLVGMRDGKPAGFGERDDVIDTVNPEVLEQNTRFIVEVLKAI